MKQILRFAVIVMMAMCAVNVSADTTIVGNEDNTTAWWSAFSSYYTIKPGETQHLEFVNYSSKTNNWNNWLVAITNDYNREDKTNYSEYAVVRCDNWGWNPSYNTSNTTWYTSLTSNYNWDTFKTDMDGSTVDMDIIREGAVVTMYAAITTSAKASYFEKFVINCGDGTQNIRAFLTTELGHLVIDNSKSAVTGISSIAADASATDVSSNAVYTLGGQRVADSKVLAKGIYVKAGKKFVVKK